MNKQAVFLLITTLLATAILSGSLSNLDLKPGQKYVLPSQPKRSMPISVKGHREYNQPLSEIPIIIVFILGGFILLISLIRLIREMSWRAIPWILFISGFGAIIMVFLKRFAKENTLVKIAAIRMNQKARMIDLPSNLIPPLWAIALIAVLGLIIVLIATWIVIRLKKEQAKLKMPFSLITREAEATANALLNGASYRVSIIRCYQQMCEIIMVHLDYDRDRFITAREFVTVLRAFGLNSNFIYQLTHLFEKARYSHSEPLESEKAEAILCLTHIKEMYHGQK